MRPAPWIVAALLCLGTASAAGAADLVGRATVIDANTLVIGRLTITLHGMIAPDPERTCALPGGGKPIACGQMAAEALRKLVPGAPVTCTQHGNDRQGNPRATCRSDKWEINRMMVEGGWARAVPAERMDYSRAEKTAVAARAGLWDYVLPH